MNAKQEGSARLSTFVWLVIFIAVGYVIYNIAPVYYANYSFSDRLTQVARTGRGFATDDRIKEMILKEADESGLAGYIMQSSCRVNTQEHRRIITCQYQREAKILPNWTRMFVFNVHADQPIL
ncbi:MAG: hypothetical protein JXO72_14700 [Vicinamibacteria bacterium]|nr:hypothetical protein [Vicinamibacteria bacterium]